VRIRADTAEAAHQSRGAIRADYDDPLEFDHSHWSKISQRNPAHTWLQRSLCAMAAFSELGVMGEITKALEELGWQLPSPIQTEAIPKP